MGMITIDFLLKIAVLIALASVRLYWYNAESEANLRRPPSNTKRTRFRNRFRIIEIAFYATLILELFVPILVFEPNHVTRLMGIALFAYGFKLSVEGRRTLGVNWHHMIDYQVKEKQALVTEGIYKHVRHPIYAGALLMLTAVQIILHSWLWIFVFGGILPFIYLQSKKEESVLARHFGKEYLKYLQSSKMFVPYIF
jgi:protein-S-isoprenylcysteine O-methyltransferase Ste14